MRTELVTTLKRQATELLSDIERHKEPILITQHGLPSAYLVDVETYQLWRASPAGSKPSLKGAWLRMRKPRSAWPDG